MTTDHEYQKQRKNLRMNKVRAISDL